MIVIPKNPSGFHGGGGFVTVNPCRNPFEISSGKDYFHNFAILVKDHILDSLARESEVLKVWETVKKFNGLFHAFNIHFSVLVFGLVQSLY